MEEMAEMAELEVEVEEEEEMYPIEIGGVRFCWRRSLASGA